MAYLKSKIEIMNDGLFKVSIMYSSWFGSHTDHESFKTVKECRDYLINQRCPHLEIISEYKKGDSKGVPESK